MSGPRISSFCSGGDCVQVELAGDGGVLVRDTKQRGQLNDLQLHFTPEEWDTFIAGAKAGEFDREALR